MPNLRSAAKALRQSKKRQVINNRIKVNYKDAVKAMRNEPTPENLKIAF